MINETKQALKNILRVELARRDFWTFCCFIDPDFFQSRPFIKDIANAFQKIENREIKSLSISLPPRAGKSYITSLFCAWTIGRNPTKSVMRNTCTATLYLKFSYDVRAILKSDKFKIVFPSVTISEDKANLQGWNVKQSIQVGYFGAGVGGTIIGFGASNVAITDDLYKGIEDALSDTVNDRIKQWKESTHDSRLESGCAVIDIGTRWSLNDVIGMNTKANYYDLSLIVPALDENNNSFCENVMSTAEYIDKRKRTAPEIWEAEYQQNPVDMKGRLFNDLQFIDKSELNEIVINKKTETNPLGFEGAIGYIDVADQGNDYLAMAILAVIDKTFYIVDYVYTRQNTDITLDLCAHKLNEWNVNYCRVESNSMGAMFARQLQQKTKTKILQVANQTNKETRIIMNSVFIMQRFIFVRNESDPEFLLFISNVLNYSKEGRNKNDDAPDCLAGLSIFTQSMFKNLI